MVVVNLAHRRWPSSLGFTRVLIASAACPAFRVLPFRGGLTSFIAGVWLYAFMWYQKPHQTRMQQQRRQAFNDALAGALLRQGWADRYARWAQARRPGGVIIAADGDNFTGINDTYGHCAGGTILQPFTTRRKRAIPPGGGWDNQTGMNFQLGIPRPADAMTPAMVHRAVTSILCAVGHGRLRFGISMGYISGPLTQTAAADLRWLAGAVHRLWAERLAALMSFGGLSWLPLTGCRIPDVFLICAPRHSLGREQGAHHTPRVYLGAHGRFWPMKRIFGISPYGRG